MIANSEDRGTLARAMGRLTIACRAGRDRGNHPDRHAAPVRLVGVTSQGDTVLIEATEPVAYSVSRPDALSLVVDLRNVSVSDARADVDAPGSDCRRAAGTGVGGGRTSARTRARRAGEAVGVRRAQRAQHHPRRAETAAPRAVRRSDAVGSGRRSATAPAPAAPVLVPARCGATAAASPRQDAAREHREEPASPGAQSATIIERIKSSKTPGATTVTLVGNGHLAPAGVTESKDRPRRLVLDFPNVTSKAPTQTAIDSPFVTRVRVAVNSHQPLVTRVVMEIAGTASYHVERER